MKKIITLLVFIVTSSVYAQNSGITYQAVIYNPSSEILPGNNNPNVVLAEKNICLRFSIIDVNTNLEYQEVQKVKTDEFGMVNLIVGEGDQVSGYAANFDAIIWNSTNKFLKVEIDASGNCTNFIEISNQKFASVPFAFASKVAESVSGIVPIVNGGTGADTVAGAKTNLGLNNVDNTSDLNKPVSTATQKALDAKENAINKSSITALGTSDILFPTQNAVKVYVDTQIANTTVPDASITTKGKIQLAGDLGGTADAPTVPELANKENTIAGGTTAQYYRGDKTWQTLDKTVVGLNNVDNTSDINKPVSTATQTALDAKAPLASPEFTGVPTAPTASAGTNTTQIATTAFVNAALSSGGAPDATTTLKGRIQLAGDLSGTAEAPTVPGLATKENAAHKSTDVNLGTSDVLFPTQKAVKTYVDNQVSSGVVDADLNTKGKIQLAGDLAGASSSAANPIISNDAISTVKIADGAVTTAKIGDANVTEAKLASNAVTSAKIVDGTIATIDLENNSVTTDKISDANVTEVKVAVNAITTAKIVNGAISTAKLANNAITNEKLGEIVNVNKGGTGADMSNAGAGYVKQSTNGANFTTVSFIPVNDVTGAVRKVNGVQPDTDGNVAVIIGRVFTGAELNPNDAPSITGATPGKQQSDIYIVADGSNPNNGRTFIYDGTTWLEVATNLSTTDSRYVNVAGDSMEGDLTFPAGKKIILNYAPANATDAANKEYVDTKIGGSGTVNFVPKFSGTSPSKILANSSIFDDGTNVGIGTTTPTSKFETVGDMKARNSANTNSVVLNTGLPSVDFASSSRTFRLGSYTGSTYNSQIDGTAYLAGVSGITQLSLNTQGNQPITFATNDWIERMRIQHTTGNVGIGTNTPATRLHVNSSIATNTVNTEGIFRMQRPQNPGVKWDNIAQFNLGSYAVSTGNTDAAHTRLDLDLNDGSSVSTSNVMTWQANGNVGIGTTAPATRLEISQGTAGNSGLRFTNLTSSSSATTSSSKVLGVNSNGDVILTNVPGTQNIVTFSTATPTTSGVVFTPNTPADQSVIYQSSTDNSLWTYNGTTYVTYTPPATTAWNLAGTTNDAGGNKLSAIERTGSASVTNGFLRASGNSNSFTMDPTQGGGPRLMLGTTLAPSSYFELGAYNGVNNFDTKARDFNVFSTARANALVLKHNTGNIGIGTNTPTAILDVNSITVASNTVNADVTMLKLARPLNSGLKFPNIAQFNLGSFSSGGQSNTRLDLNLSNTNDTDIPNVMTWQANGNVGIGTTSPGYKLSVIGNTRIQPNTLNNGSGEPVWVEIYGKAPPATDTQAGGIKLGWYNTFGGIEVVRPGSASGVGLAFNYATTGGTTTEGFRLTNAGRVGIGTTAPNSTLEVNGSATNTAAFNNGGSATAIAFSMSNLAYTTLSPQLFALTGIKDGGTYTLAVQGPNQGTSTFMAPGFTFRYVNNGPSIANTHTLYTFIVMGTTVYVYTTIGFTTP